MQHNIKKEKSDINILTANLNSKKSLSNKTSSNVSRPDTLEIRIKQDNGSNLISKSNLCNDNVNWSTDNLDNFITHLKNVNNTPSPITPNSFFNPSDVTQDQEQFADTLTVHLNKIKEEYKSSIESSESTYLNNVIQLTSVNDDRPLQIATVSVGNKVYLVNQISAMDDNNSHQMTNHLNHNVTTNNNNNNNNPCLNYGVIDIPNNITLTNDVNCAINPQNTIILQKNPTSLSQQLKISNIASLRTQCGSNIVFSSTPNMQPQHQASQFTQANFPTHRNVNELITNNIVPITTEMAIAQSRDVSNNNSVRNDIIQPVNIIKSSDGILYTRIPDSTQTQLLNQLNSITANNNILVNSNRHLTNQMDIVPPPQIKPVNITVDNTNVNSNSQNIMDSQCLSVNSSATESSCGLVNSTMHHNNNVSRKDCVSNNNNNNMSSSKHSNTKDDDKNMDEQQRRLERKRARNRDAARKCRDRKNTLIMTLEQKYAKQCEEKEIIREKLCKSLEEIRRLTDYIAKHDPNSKFSSFANFLQEIKIHELTETDLKDLNLL